MEQFLDFTREMGFPKSITILFIIALLAYKNMNFFSDKKKKVNIDRFIFLHKEEIIHILDLGNKQRELGVSFVDIEREIRIQKLLYSIRKGYMRSIKHRENTAKNGYYLGSIIPAIVIIILLINNDRSTFEVVLLVFLWLFIEMFASEYTEMNSDSAAKNGTFVGGVFIGVALSIFSLAALVILAVIFG